jgi:hypothetical protein
MTWSKTHKSPAIPSKMAGTKRNCSTLACMGHSTSLRAFASFFQAPS